jgi:hypothetical protein
VIAGHPWIPAAAGLAPAHARRGSTAATRASRPQRPWACRRCATMTTLLEGVGPSRWTEPPSRSPRRRQRRRIRRVSNPGGRERTSSMSGKRPALRACTTHAVWAWRRRAGSPSGITSMCWLSAGSSSPQKGHRYVAGLRLAAGRTEYQRAAAKLPTTPMFAGESARLSVIRTLRTRFTRRACCGR